jgi:hypothetical protein
VSFLEAMAQARVLLEPDDGGARAVFRALIRGYRLGIPSGRKLVLELQ